MIINRPLLGPLTLLVSLSVLTACGGGSGTDNKKPDLVTCLDPQVLLDNGQCGNPRENFIPPACPDEQIRDNKGVCVVPDFPAPSYQLKEGEAVIYVNVDNPSKDAIFNNYNLHLWQDCGNGWGASATDSTNAIWSIPTTWPNGPGVTSTPAQHDPYYGAYFVIPVNQAGTCGNFILKTKDGNSQTNDQSMTIKWGGDYDRMAWVIINQNDMRSSRVSSLPICINDVCTLKKPLLSFTDAEAHWISPRTIVWDRAFAEGKAIDLFSSLSGGMSASEEGELIGGEKVATLTAGRPLNENEKALVPHLQNYIAYDLPESLSIEKIKELLTHELLIIGRIDIQEDDKTVEIGQGTRIQLPHVLDALYTEGEMDADEAELGVRYSSSGVTASVWAPTAQLVELRVYSQELRLVDSKPMQRDNATGIWSFTGSLAELDKKYYRYRVTAYSPETKRVQRREVTDPYSVSLSPNGIHSQFVNLQDAETQPSGWDAHQSPAATALEQISIYEIHVRDFSVSDQSTTPANRGKYLAFTETNSVPMQHLRSLKDAGLTHVHFLPINDSSNVNETFNQQVNLDSYLFDLCQRSSNTDAIAACQSGSKAVTIRSLLESYDPTSSQARELVDAMKEMDGFNWGYDPQHFNAPEGNYASDSKGVTRVKEMRAMVKSLHDLGLRVVLDVVYPHTVSEGVDVANSVFDKIVPGYYYRTDKATAKAEQGTKAGPDTATEHRMMAKFVKDSVLHWNKHFGIDGFRFDQSGYMPKSVLVDAYQAVQAQDSSVYFYAEAWNPLDGTSSERIDELATQPNLAGTGMGTFNDKLRDPLQKLALIKGENVDIIKVGLAGNLAAFPLAAKSGALITGDKVGAYNLDPQEAINYVEKHDNETFWDWMHLPDALDSEVKMADRVRIHSLTQAIPVLSQGVAFIHAGADLLRSKSMSSNSYNAGDWFNKIDFTKQDNNWAKGLPPELHYGVDSQHVVDLFNNPETYVNPSSIQQASEVFKEFLSIRSNSPLFNLPTQDDVIDRVGFHNVGKAQTAGVIVMSIDDGVSDTNRADLDPSVDALVVVFNGTHQTQSMAVPTAVGFTLHSTQQNGADAVVKTSSFSYDHDADKGTFTVPAYTVAVFVKAQEGSQGQGLAADVSMPRELPPPYGDTPVYVRGDVTAAAWGAEATNQMQYVGDGIYILEVQLGEMENKAFKFADADWGFPNIGVGADPLVVGEWAAIEQDSQDDLTLTITEAGLYRFELDASNVDAPKARVSNPDVYRAAPVQLVGTPTGWGFNSANSIALTHISNSRYEARLTLTADDTAPALFKFANVDWSGVILGGADENAIELGAPKALINDGGSKDLKLMVPVTDEYLFSIDARDPDAPIITVTNGDTFAGTEIFVRGQMNGWSTDDQLVYQGEGIYKAVITITSQNDYAFKIASEDWSTVDRGVPESSKVVSVGSGHDFHLGGNDTDMVDAVINLAAGSYVFEVDATDPLNPILTVTAE